MLVWTRLIVSVISLNLFFIIIAIAADYDEYDMPPPGTDIIGELSTLTVKKGYSLDTIREQYNISYEELLEANPSVKFNSQLTIGQKIVIPKQFVLPKIRQGIVINIPELRLYYFTQDGTKVYTFPVGLGRQNWRTPLISSKVISKIVDPSWHVPASIHEYTLNKTGKNLPAIMPPGPENPIGKYAFRLNIDGYLIHGTNSPSSVGTFISSGCMRILREPLELLYQKVQVGTPVHVVYSPSKAGWLNNKLYLEAHKPVGNYAHMQSPLNIDTQAAIHDAIYSRHVGIDQNAVDTAVNQHLGIPVQISLS